MTQRRLIDRLSRPWRLLRGVAFFAAVTGGVWLLFRYVVTDSALLLAYIKALVWPVALAVCVFWLRDSVRDKFHQLLRLDVFGAAAEFSHVTQAANRDLQDGLDQPFADLELTGPEPELEAESELEPAPEPESELEPKSEPELEPKSEPEPEPEIGVTAWQAMQALATAVGVVLDRDPGDVDDQQGELDRLVAAAAAQRAAAESPARRAARTKSRKSIEEVIRKSAEWGYKMGRAGAPAAHPDVEWLDDGTWRITTEVPKAPPATSKPTREYLAELYSENRAVRDLEKEIKDLERQRVGRFGGLSPSLRGLGIGPEDAWLKELRRRLRLVDPGNVWAQDTFDR